MAQKPNIGLTPAQLERTHRRLALVDSRGGVARTGSAEGDKLAGMLVAVTGQLVARDAKRRPSRAK